MTTKFLYHVSPEFVPPSSPPDLGAVSAARATGAHFPPAFADYGLTSAPTAPGEPAVVLMEVAEPFTPGGDLALFESSGLLCFLNKQLGILGLQVFLSDDKQSWRLFRQASGKGLPMNEGEMSKFWETFMELVK